MNHRIICWFEICNNYYIYIKPVCSWKSTGHLNSNFWKFVPSKPNIFIHLTYQYNIKCKNFFSPTKKSPSGDSIRVRSRTAVWKKKLISARKCLFITEEISNFSSIRSYYKISTKYLAKDVHQHIQYNILFYLNNASSFKGICGETGYFF